MKESMKESIRREINILVRTKESERYVFLFDDESYKVVCQKMVEFASNPDLSFTWFDAVSLFEKIEKIQEGDFSS